MHAAQVTTWGDVPKYTEVPDLPSPTADQVQIKVTATGLHQVVRSRATGKHYTATKLPHIPGVDGAGVTSDGQAVYFNALSSGGSTFADTINAPRNQVFPLPEGLDPVRAAALVNPGLSSWMALKYRTSNLPPNFTVLIVGATSASGKLAITNARRLGARKVYGIARDASKLQNQGLDKTFNLGEYTDGLAEVDVVLDYIYGESLGTLLAALPSGRPIQYVQIGALGGSVSASLDSGFLRGKDITIRGAGPGAWNPRALGAEIPDILASIAESDYNEVEVYKLSDIEAAWATRSSKRIVIRPGSE